MSLNYSHSIIAYTPFMKEYADRVSDNLVPKVGRHDFKPEEISIEYFSNKEQKPTFTRSVRGKHVYLIHGFFDEKGEYEPDKGFMQAYLTTNALVNASVARIIYIFPHKPYERQDRLDKPHVPISAECVMSLLKASAKDVPTSLVTFDMHVPQIQGFFNPSDNLFAAPLVAEHIKREFPPDNTTLVSPDAGGAARTRYLAKILHMPMALCDKRRDEDGKPEIINVIGDVKGRQCIIYDDMIDTSGTLEETRNALVQRGALDLVYAAAPHALMSFSKKKNMPSEDILRNAGMKIFTTDSVPRKMEYYRKNSDVISAVLSTAPITSRVIHEIDTEGSVSEIYKTGKYNPSAFYELLFKA